MDKPKHQVKLYNIGFHPIFFYLFPTMWLVSLPVNFVVDSLVLLLALKLFVKNEIFKNYKKVILKTWLFGYLSDLVATGMILGAEFLAGWLGRGSILLHPFGDVVSFLCVFLSVVAAGVLIYVLNLKIALKKTELDLSQKKKVAMMLAAITAPYLFFLPLSF